MAEMAVAHDMVEVHRPGDAGPLVQLARIGPEIGVIDDAAAVALEVQVTDRIEADQGREQPPVGLGDARADQVASTGMSGCTTETGTCSSSPFGRRRIRVRCAQGQARLT